MAIMDLIPWGSGRRDMARRGAGPHSMQAGQTDINRLFEDFFRGFPFPGLAMQDHLAASAGSPQLDIRDTGKEIEVKAELPGMDDGDVEVRISDGALVIYGEKKSGREEDERGYLLRERSFGKIERMVPLPDGVDPDGARARFENGVLTVVIPKTQQAQDSVKHIEVRRG